MMEERFMPEAAEEILTHLLHAGYEAYAVGGCVRDRLLERTPHDWDFCTSALPEEIKAVFSFCPVIETGIRHGTVTVLLNHIPYEITTYRIDGAYSDNRRPDRVVFTRSLQEDLARRDFTVNAMAYSPKTGIVDPFGGAMDCRDKIIRCVGEPEKRFQEDALRILRALRFSSRLGFFIEDQTAAAALKLSPLLENVAWERIGAEFSGIINGMYASEVLEKFSPVFAQLIPEIQPMIGFDQHNVHHVYDVWTHTLKVLKYSGEDSITRLAAFFHDIGKPGSFSMDEEGCGHFYRHARLSETISEAVLHRLRFDTRTIREVCDLVRVHDAVLNPEKKQLLRLLRRLGEEQLWRLIDLNRADAMGQNPIQIQERTARLDEVSALLKELLQEQPCFTVKALAINGHDLQEIGIAPGKQMGKLLNILLEAVIREELPNEREQLLSWVQNHQSKEAASRQQREERK